MGTVSLLVAATKWAKKELQKRWAVEKGAIQSMNLKATGSSGRGY